MKIILFVGMAVYGLVAAAPMLAPANSCRAVLKLKTWGLDMYCPSVQCAGQQWECTENSDDSDTIHWCACGVGGTFDETCHASWTDNADGTVATIACQNNGCAAPTPNCSKNVAPVVVGNWVYACACQ